MADEGRPRRPDAIVRLGYAEPAVHERSVVAREPPDLPRLEDRARGRGDRVRAGGEAAGGRERERREDRDRHSPGAHEAAQAQRPGEGEQRRSGREQRPLLVGDRQAQQDSRREWTLTRRQQDGHHAQASAEQLLGVPEFERAQRDRVGDADRQRHRAGEQGGVSPRAHPRDQEHAERRSGHEARKRDHAVDGERPAAPYPGYEGERRALDQRASVRRREAQEFAEVAVCERVEARRGLDFVVVPREAVQPQPRDRRAAGDRRERAQGVLAQDLPHV